jgi:flagellar hook-associated protein 2
MATTTAVGGSQIDVQSLVSQLVSAERAQAMAPVNRDTQRVTTQISALGSLMGSMSNYRSALSSLKTVDVFSARSATSSDEKAFTASSTAKATPGSYNIEVVKVAKAQQLSSTPFAGGSTTVVGSGTLTLDLGGKSFSVDIASDKNTLADVRDAINNSKDNVGVRATIVTGTTGARLVLSSGTTGAANKITVSQTGGDGGLSKVAYSAAAPANYTEITAPQDAIVNIANAQTKSASNTIDGAIDGVTLTILKETDPDEEPPTLTVGYDSAAVTSRIKTFVTAYNSLAGTISKLDKYDATSKTAGPMIGDSMLQGIEAEMRRTISTPVAGQSAAFSTLASVGITTQADGTLAIDDTKLQKALSTNFEQVGKLFGSDNGVGAKLFKQADDRLKATSALQVRSDGLAAQQKSIEKRTDDIEARMLVIQKAYTAQFTRLDTMLSQMQVTSSYLSQQIQSLQAQTNG